MVYYTTSPTQDLTGLKPDRPSAYRIRTQSWDHWISHRTELRSYRGAHLFSYRSHL